MRGTRWRCSTCPETDQESLPVPTEPNHEVKRDIDVTATHSSRDPSPTFELNGDEQPLRFDDGQGKWRGHYPDFLTPGVLRVKFASLGTNNQRFDVVVTATDRTNPDKPKTKTFTGIAKDGSVDISGTMDV